LLTSVSAHGVKTWKVSNGQLVWHDDAEDVVSVVPVGSSTASDGTPSTSFEDVLVTRKQEIVARSAKGSKLWRLSAKDAVGKDATLLGAVALAGGKVSVVAQDGKDLLFAVIFAQDGSVSKRGELPMKLKKGQSGILQSSSFVVVDGRTVKACSYDASKDMAGTFKAPGSGSNLTFIPVGVDGILSVTDGTDTWVLRYQDGKLSELAKVAGVHAVGPVHLAFGVSTVAVALAAATAEGLSVQLLAIADGVLTPLLTNKEYSSTNRGKVKKVLVTVDGDETGLVAGARPKRPRAILVAEDGSLTTVDLSGTAWVREEALATVTDAKFAPLPREKKDYGPGPIVKMLKGDFSFTYSDVIETVSREYTAISNALLNSLPPPVSHESKVISPEVPKSNVAIRFGGDQIIATATCTGKMFGLDSLAGYIVWSRFFPGSSCDASGKPRLHMQLLPSDETGEAPILLVAVKTEAGLKQMVWLDPLTGETKKGSDVKSKAARHVVPVGDKVALVGEDHTVTVVPAGDISNELTEHPVYLYEVDRKSRVITGYRLRQNGLELAWIQDLAHEERILVAESVGENARNGAPVLVKGDSSILYRYIEPNLLVVVAERGATMTLYILGTVSGNLVQSFEVVGGSEPVKVLAVDNAVVMHYWSMQNTRFELLSVELFANMPDPGAAAVVMGQHNKTRPAHDYVFAPRPLVASQNHIYPHGFTSFGVSCTKNGVTPRALLLATTTNRIHTLSLDHINPRKHPPKEKAPLLPPPPNHGFADQTPPPAKNQPTIDRAVQPTKTETLTPYRPIVMANPLTDYMTFGHQVFHIQGIATAPSSMESTSLAFAYGLDLFYAPVQPAGGYDLLAPDFNFMLLILSGIGCAIAVVFGEWYSTHKGLLDLWK
jgi:hypothetical protein